MGEELGMEVEEKPMKQLSEGLGKGKRGGWDSAKLGHKE